MQPQVLQRRENIITHLQFCMRELVHGVTDCSALRAPNTVPKEHTANMLENDPPLSNSLPLLLRAVSQPGKQLTAFVIA